jgi:hypothetical protein
MERFTALGRGMQIMLVAGVLLLIDSFFRWQEISADVLGIEVSGGVSAWDDVGGIVMGLLTIVLVAWIVVRIAAIEIPLPFSAAMIGAALGALILLFALIKNLTDDYSTFWSYLGIAFAAAIAFGAWLEVQAAGGMETLRSEMPGMASSAPATPAAPPPPAPPEAPPAAPEAYTPSPPPATEPAEPEAAPDEPEPASDEPGERTDREM